MDKQGTSTELIPRPWMPEQLETMSGVLLEVSARVRDLANYVETHTVQNREDSEQMQKAVVALKELRKDCVAAVGPIKNIVNRAHDFIQTEFAKPDGDAKKAIALAATKLAEWDKEEERKARAEQKQAQEALEKKRVEEAAAQLKADQKAAAERKNTRLLEIKKMQKDGTITKPVAAKMMREAGGDFEAQLLEAEAEAEAHVQSTPTVNVEPNKVRVSGTIRRKTYLARCLDRRAFIKEFVRRYQANELEQKVVVTRANGEKHEIIVSWLDFMNVSDEALSKVAREEIKDVETCERIFPGVKCEERQTY